ncbi:type II toxin-antitoxin system RelB/DinJ family antitoxin [Acidipropionibacterium virtanenii]|uniref:Antitoxin DinJ n=1 Tax=Acidipropionibacterium virtanenii TaxID=2057246 RepID=A0A344UQD0_9ACTN|nr:type II toxin-antitoxin system RelB/DinJ family antitoxin [Acidipropionibacterium virtanenii]AXE37478.1 hypothetical protein JS278_00281 [Acidipropionibacterium virtanenii]
MPATTLNIRIDPELKEQVDQVARSLGLSSSAAFNIFARQFVAYRGFPFPVVAPVPTEADFSRQMDAVFDRMRAGHSQEHNPIEEPR